MKKETAFYIGSIAILIQDIQFIIDGHHRLLGVYFLNFQWSLVLIILLNLSFFPYMIYYFKTKKIDDP
jgi:hypothetical protein